MDNYLATINDVLFDGTLTKARDNSTVRQIESVMLDGSVSIQVIGAAATKISVEFYCSVDIRRSLQASANSAAPLKIAWEDKIWTGIISGSITIEKIAGQFLEKLNFDVVVVGVVDR